MPMWSDVSLHHRQWRLCLARGLRGACARELAHLADDVNGVEFSHGRLRVVPYFLPSPLGQKVTLLIIPGLPSVVQDEVGTFPNRVAYEIMKEDLGAPPEEIFEFVYPDPVASASIGQVRSGKPSLPSGDRCSLY